VACPASEGLRGPWARYSAIVRAASACSLPRIAALKFAVDAMCTWAAGAVPKISASKIPVRVEGRVLEAHVSGCARMRMSVVVKVPV